MMAALMGRPGSRRGKMRRPGTGPTNVYVEDAGRRYRVCFMPRPWMPRVLMVMLKCRAGGERALDIDGRRAKQIIRKVGVRWEPVMDSRTRGASRP
jgi:hypothetical protein